jgi:hypothetical protein
MKWASLTKKSILTGKTWTKTFPGYSQEEFMARVAILDKHFIQDVFPNLTPSQWDFILTGIPEEEWEEVEEIEREKKRRNLPK